MGMLRPHSTAVGFALSILLLLSPPSTSAATREPCRSSLTNCPDEGCGGGDLNLNRLKNRTGHAGGAEDWTVHEILNLEVPSVGKNAPREDAEDQGEGSPVRVSGYLIYGEKTRTPESCNCYLRGEENNDFHLNLVAAKNDGKAESVVVEISPRFRPQGWDLSKIRALAKKRTYVRITGWLLLDNMHLGASTARGTPWEVHPVTACQVCTRTVTKCKQGIGWRPLAEYVP